MSGEPGPLNNVELNLLKALDVLLQERSVTRAAHRLALTQPTTPLPQHALFTDRFVGVAWERNDRAREPLTFAQFDELPYLSYKLGPVLAMVDETLLGLGRPREPDTIVSSFRLGAFMLRGTSQVTFLQMRLAEKLKAPAELKLLTPPFPSPTVTETMTWHPRNDQKPAHRWLRTRILALARDLLGPSRRVSMASGPLLAKVGYSDDLRPTSLAESTCALKPLRGEIAHLLFDCGIVCVVGGVGEKSRRLLVIASRKPVARLGQEALDIEIVDHGPSSLLLALHRSGPLHN